MLSVYSCKTKKALKEKIGRDAESVLMETGMLGPELSRWTAARQVRVVDTTTGEEVPR